MVKFTHLNKIVKQAGFTLLELLIVLSIWSMLLLLAVPITFNTLNHMKEQQFLNTFKHDVLYTQSLALINYNDLVRLRIREDHYEIISGNVNTLNKVRPIPDNWHFYKNSMNDISFTKNGTIRDAGQLTLTTPLSTYQIVFPPGKGRCYIVKQ